jgi:hypothetical protein
MVIEPPAYRLRPVAAGDSYCRATQGGVRSTKAPGPGVVVAFPEYDLFIPLGELTAILSQLVPRASPRRAAAPAGVLPGDEPVDG